MSDTMDIGPEDVEALSQEVVCGACGHTSVITAHPVPGHEQRWKCNCFASIRYDAGNNPVPGKGLDEVCRCAADNVEPGEVDGEPGEGMLNPAASAVSDEDLLEAVVRRGLVHKLDLTGGAEPNGEATRQ